MTELHAALADVDDCWNRIGIRGDQSCPKLPEYVHCRNCPVYASAARRLLDRLPPQVELEGADAAGDAAATAGEPALRRASLLVFRLHREWLGLPTGRWTRWPPRVLSCRCRTGATRRCWA